jgi:tetratricopeptide (TPR) repeat protein
LLKLAASYYAQNRHSDAESRYRRALAILEKTLGPENPELADSLQKLALVLRKMKRNEEAMDVESHARTLLQK